MSVTTITRNCVIDLHQTGSVGAGSDHLQLIKFWPSCASGKGVCGGANFFGYALLQPARSVCVSLSAFLVCFSTVSCLFRDSARSLSDTVTVFRDLTRPLSVFQSSAVSQCFRVTHRI